MFNQTIESIINKVLPLKAELIQCYHNNGENNDGFEVLRDNIQYELNDIENIASDDLEIYDIEELTVYLKNTYGFIWFDAMDPNTYILK